VTAKDPQDDMQQAPLELARGTGGGRFPVPDPTTLTTEALRREVASLQVLIEQRISALKELLMQEISAVRDSSDSSDKRMDLRHEAMREEIETKIGAAKSYCDSQFGHIEKQLAAVEAMRVEQKNDTKAAVDAALTAQKEAVREQTTASELAIAKSEAAIAKQIEQLTVAGNTARDELRRGIDDTKERIGTVERELRSAISSVDTKANTINALAQGATGSRASLFAWIGGVGAVLAIIIIVANLLSASG
jgi:ribosome-associated translation inhibitor RaiA